MNREYDVSSGPRVGGHTRTTWLPWSAASLACGSVLMVLGSLLLPADGSFADLIASVEGDEGQWVIASFTFFFASVGMTLGLPAVITLLPQRGRRTGLIGIGVWTIGTIGLAGYAALLMLFRAVVESAHLTADDVAAVSHDATLLAFVAIFVLAFLIGETLTALALLRSRAVSRWIAVLLLVHVGLQVVSGVLPEVLKDAQAMLLGVAMMGVAVQANDEWTAGAG